MSRNRYTKLVHKEQRMQIARQEKELAAVRRTLRRPDTNVAVSADIEIKQRRRARLERRRLDKPARYAVTVVGNQSAPTTTGIAA